MAFIPATPGLVGFGGGSKPAIFQAVAPQYSLMNQQTGDEDTPPVFCHDALGDVLNYAASGIAACSGCYPLPNSLGPDRDVKFSFSGINGTGSATWNGTSAWLGSPIGTVTATVFASTDGSCSGSSFDVTVNAGIVITCLGEDKMAAGINGSPMTILGFTWAVNVFVDTIRVDLADPIPNELSSGDCGPVGVTDLNVAFGGTITVVVPP